MRRFGPATNVLAGINAAAKYFIKEIPRRVLNDCSWVFWVGDVVVG